MSHFVTVVFVRGDNADDAESLLAPYNENITVAPYYEPCFCAHRALREAVEAVLTAEFGDFDAAFRRPYWALPEERRPDWDQLTLPYRQRQQQLEAELAAQAVPDPACCDCHGSGQRISRYNPQSKWDWYQLGGRWDGYLTLAGGNTANVAAWGDLANPPEQPFAFIDPDGFWHQRAEMGWWGMTSGERDAAFAAEWQAQLAQLRPDDLVYAYDLHI